MFRLAFNTRNFISTVGIVEKNSLFSTFRHYSSPTILKKQLASKLFKINQIRFNSTISKGIKNAAESEPVKKKLTMKELIKQYGYVGLAVYLGLGSIDLVFCYILVEQAGAETIKEYENKVKEFFGYGQKKETAKEQEEDLKTASFWTKFLIAYGIHKSLIFIRFPIAAYITPLVVRKLQSWGYKVGARKIAKAAVNVVKKSAK